MEDGCVEQRLNFESHVARLLLYPKFTSDGDVFADEKCFNFGRLDSKNVRSEYVISVGCFARLGSIDALHAFGCRTAANANSEIAKRKTAKNLPFNRHDDGVYYIGAYMLDSHSVRGLRSDAYEIVIEEYFEHNEPAHFHLSLKIRDGVPTATRPDRDDLSDKRLDIIRALSRISSGPLRHVCPADSARSAELAQIEIPRRTHSRGRGP